MVSFSDVLPTASVLSPAMDDRQIGKAAPKRAPRHGWRALSGLSRFTGVVLMLAAVGIWLLSGSLWDAEMMLLRLGVSVVFMCLGLALLHAGRRTARDEIHLDQRARELRHVRRGHDGIARLRQRLALRDLSEVVIDEDRLVLRGRDGQVLLELSGMDRDQLLAVQQQVKAA
jgi:hypothetical protein